MMARLGFHANETSLLEPLNIAQARKLQLATDRFADHHEPDGPRPRSKTADVSDASEGDRRLKRVNTIEGIHQHFEKNALVGFEQLIHSYHRDADGQNHTASSFKQKVSGATADDANASRRDSVKKVVIDAAFEKLLARKAFRTDNCKSWDAGDDDDFKYVRK